MSALTHWLKEKPADPDQEMMIVGQNQKSLDNWRLNGWIYVVPGVVGVASGSVFPSDNIGVPGWPKIWSGAKALFKSYVIGISGVVDDDINEAAGDIVSSWILID